MSVIAIIGTGQIATSMAVLFTGNGHPCWLVSRSEASSVRMLQDYKDYFADLAAAGLVTAEQAECCQALLTITRDINDIKNAEYVIEAIIEDLAAKHNLYRQIEAVCEPDVVIASVTSGIPPDQLASEMAYPERLLVAHPFMPPHLVPCIEIVRGAATTDAAVENTISMFESVGRIVVVLKKSVAGFIANRLQYAMLREAVHLIEQGVTTAEDIDRTLMTSFGPRYSNIGLFEHMENAGLDLCASIQEYLLPLLSSAQGVQPAIAEKVAAGDLGSKTGRGFLDWSKTDMADFRVRRSQPYYKFFNWQLPE